MKHYRNILPLAAALIAAACGGDSALPNPTGKASIRAINAISGSSTVDFRIEELSIAGIEYREISSGESYDDFSYTFNFDIRYAGDAETTRIASETIQFVADQDYTLLLSGTIDAPTVTVWEIPEREFADGATVFQTRFAHTADSLSADSIDIYFAPDGTVPVLGEQVATVAFGEITAPRDFPEGEYVTTVTRAGDVNDVLFVSSPTTIAALGDLIVTPFDATENEIDPVGVFILSDGGSEFEMTSPNHQSVIQFLHAAADLGDVDVYDDEALTSLVYDNLTYQQLTPEQPISNLNGNYLYTPFDSTGSVIVERDIIARGDRRYRLYLNGTAGEYAAILATPDRRPVDTAAKVVFINEAQNFDFVNVYAMEPGEVPDATSQILRPALGSGGGPVTSFIADGMYDLYIAEAGVTDFNIIAGPLSIDVALRDVIDFVVFDNVADPAIADLVQLVETP